MFSICLEVHHCSLDNQTSRSIRSTQTNRHGKRSSTIGLSCRLWVPDPFTQRKAPLATSVSFPSRAWCPCRGPMLASRFANQTCTGSTQSRCNGSVSNVTRRLRHRFKAANTSPFHKLMGKFSLQVEWIMARICFQSSYSWTLQTKAGGICVKLQHKNRKLSLRKGR